jgi:hypothetical protein
VVAELEVFALVFGAVELSPEVLVLAAEPEVVSAVAELEICEPQASVDIAAAFVVLVPVSVVVVEVDSSGRPKFLAFPNVDHYASSSNSVEVVGKESVHSSTGVRTNCGLCSILSNLGLHQNKNLKLCYNNPIDSLASMEQEDCALLPSSSLNKADYQNDNGNHQRDVNEPSHRVTGDQPQQPQNYQYYSNRPQHVILLLRKVFYL